MNIYFGKEKIPQKTLRFKGSTTPSWCILTKRTIGWRTECASL